MAVRMVAACVAILIAVDGAGAQSVSFASQLPGSGGLVGAVADATAESYYHRMAAERFVASDDAVVLGYSFWGYSENYFFPDPINVFSFRMRIYEDAGGQPGASIYDQTYSPEELHISDSEMFGHSGGIIGRFTADLLTPLQIQRGRAYWFAINANYRNANGDAFFWACSLQGDASRARFNFDGLTGDESGSWTIEEGAQTDLAFVLRADLATRGACCIPSGGCDVMTDLACAAASGEYQGDLTACDDWGRAVTVDAPISDAGLPLTSTLHFDRPVSLADLQVDLYMEHDWIGDLTATLTHTAPDGSVRTVDLFRRIDVEAFGGAQGQYGDRSAVDGTYVFNDRDPAFHGFWSAATSTTAVVAAGAYDAVTTGGAPVDLFAGLFPEGSGPATIEGDWTLTVRDEEPYFIGTLRAWRLRLFSTQTPVYCDAPVPTGACCRADGSCAVATATECAAGLGAYRGDGAECVPTGCPRSTGSCCIDRCTCVVATESECLTQSGVFGGAGSECGQAACLANPVCPCDWNGADLLDSQDLFDFLESFFGSGADFNCADGTDSQDYFDFIECFFSPSGGCGA